MKQKNENKDGTPSRKDWLAHREKKRMRWKQIEHRRQDIERTRYSGFHLQQALINKVSVCCLQTKNTPNVINDFCTFVKKILSRV